MTIKFFIKYYLKKKKRCQRETTYYQPWHDKLNRETSATINAKKQWHSKLKVLKENSCKPRILYTDKLLFMTK